MNGELHISFLRAFLVGQEGRGNFTRGATVNHYPCVIHMECDLLLEPAGLNGTRLAASREAQSPLDADCSDSLRASASLQEQYLLYFKSSWMPFHASFSPI